MWEYWSQDEDSGLHGALHNFNDNDDSQSHENMHHSGEMPQQSDVRRSPAVNRVANKKRRMEFPLDSPHLTPSLSNAFLSPQLPSWPSPQMGTVQHQGNAFFSPRFPSLSSPSLNPSMQSAFTSPQMAPIALSDINRMNSDSSGRVQPFAFPYLGGYSGQHGDMDSVPRGDGGDKRGEGEGRTHMMNRLGHQSYEALKKNTLSTLAQECSNRAPSHAQAAETLSQISQSTAAMLDIEHLNVILESPEGDIAAEELDKEETLGEKGGDVKVEGQRKRKREQLTHEERVVRLQEAMEELKYTTERVLHPLHCFVVEREELVQQQSQHFDQLVKQIAELQPHYSSLCKNFEMLCKHLRRKPGLTR